MTILIIQLLLVLLCLAFHVPLFVRSSPASPNGLISEQQCHDDEREVLLEIKMGFTIKNVSDPYGFCSVDGARIGSWKNGTDCCKWSGVSCDDSTGHVTDLNLECSFLSGTFRLSKLHKLPSLSLLTLSQNHLSIIDDTMAGSGPGSTSSWPSFRYLDLSSCNLGHFPSLLRQQVNIEVLMLSNNGIHGVVPEWLLDLGSTSLSILDLSYNSLTGGLEVLPWRNMEDIDIRSNMLQGPLPIPSPTTTYFWASNNSFSGGIPTSLCDMGVLALLDLSQNNLTGQVPGCLAYLISGCRIDVLEYRP